jgi:tetratricopeptide (TPR) repeat protein
VLDVKQKCDSDLENTGSLESTYTYLKVQVSTLNNYDIEDNCSDIDEYTSIAKKLLKKGIECQNSHQLVSAVMNLQESLALFHACGDLERQAVTLSHLALVAHHANDYKSVISYSQQCLSLVEADSGLEFQLLTNLGDSHHHLGNVDQAIIFLRQSLRIVKKQQDKFNQVTVLNNLGILYKASGKIRRAIVLKRKSLEIVREIKNHYLEAQILKNLANTWYDFGDYHTAIAYYEQWMIISNLFNHPYYVIEVLGKLGEANYVLGNYAKAVKHYEKRLELAGMLKDTEMQQQTLLSLKMTFAALGDYQRAKMYEEMMGEVIE